MKFRRNRQRENVDINLASLIDVVFVLLLFFVAFKLGLNATDHFWHHGYSIGATASLFVV